MTILAELKPLRYATPITEALQARIQLKLITLFNQLCHVDKESITCEFSPIISGVNTINASFKYAVVEMIIREDNIEVVFYLKEDQHMEKVPVGAQELVVITDEDMNYESATFNSSFLFGTPIKRGTLKLNRKVDSHFTVVTSLTYDISSYGRLLYQFHLKHEHLPKIYMSNDNNFYRPFVKIIHYCFHLPEIFYSVFDDYPSHQDMLSDEYDFKSFLRNFNNEYKSGKKLLKSKIALLDMQAI